jgi:phospholipid/cholesterol/gamma-HCH transport system permease protein
MASVATTFPARAATRPPFSVERTDGIVRLSGALCLASASAIWAELRHAVMAASGPEVVIDLAGATTIDGAVLALIVALRTECERRDVTVEIRGVPEHLRQLVELYTANKSCVTQPRRGAQSAFEQVGRGTHNVILRAKTAVAFLGEMVVALRAVVRSPRTGHLREVPSLVERAGADALPIVLLLDFLIGFVMAYQSSRQLKLYGANVYVADVVGLSVTRELAPLMTAIIVCGRTGAAYAAELGTMKVSEEIDALRVLGLRPFSWLILPRVIALLVAVPALTIIGDIVGVLGGALVGATNLDVSFWGYISETRGAVTVWDIEHGLIKSMAFGLAIALVSCQQGFATSGGAEGVGRSTTNAVVISLFALVVLDATITFSLRALGFQ